jgi:hypothetical protein
MKNMDRELIAQIHKHEGITRYRADKLRHEIDKAEEQILKASTTEKEWMLQKTFSQFLINRKGWKPEHKQKIDGTEFMVKDDKILFRPKYGREFAPIALTRRGYAYDLYKKIYPLGMESFIFSNPIFESFREMGFKEIISVENLKYLSDGKIKKAETPLIQIEYEFPIYEFEAFLSYESVYNRALEILESYKLAIEKYNLEVIEHLKKVQAHLDTFETFLVTFKLQEGK